MSKAPYMDIENPSMDLENLYMDPAKYAFQMQVLTSSTLTHSILQTTQCHSHTIIERSPFSGQHVFVPVMLARKNLTPSEYGVIDRQYRLINCILDKECDVRFVYIESTTDIASQHVKKRGRKGELENNESCLLYTSPSPRDRQKSRMPSSA